MEAWMRWPLILALVFALCATGACADRWSDCSQHRDTDRQIRGCTQIIERGEKETRKNRAIAYTNRGHAYQNKGEVDRAFADFDKAIALDPKLAIAYYNRGVTYRKKGEIDRAIADYTKAIALNPKYAIAYYNRGIAYKKKGDVDRTIADYTKAIALNPNFAFAYNNRGLAYLTKGEFDRAIADYDKVIALNPKDALAYNARAWAYFERGKSELGLPDAERAVELAPDSAPILDTRGQIYAALGRREEAIADLKKALSIDPSQKESREALEGLGVTAAGGAQCFDAARARVADSQAFKVNCKTAADCEFESAQAQNVSAMALIDDIAKNLQDCWKKAGLKTVTELTAPEGMKLHIRRYSAPDAGASAEICTVAELKPFGDKQLTTSFRAQCKGD